jgi:hypothetical protein
MRGRKIIETKGGVPGIFKVDEKVLVGAKWTLKKEGGGATLLFLRAPFSLIDFLS